MTTPDVELARALFEESAEVRANLANVEVTRPLVACAELVPALCDEVERGLAGMRQLLEQRDRLAESLDHVCRHARDDSISAEFVRTYLLSTCRELGR